MFAIVVSEKGGEPKRLEFDKPEITIGRVQGNDVILAKGNVSKRHSRLVLKDGKFIIVDLKSTNGTYVNGRKISSPQVVRGTDRIYIGDFILTVEELQAAAEDLRAQPLRRPPTIPPPPPRRTQPPVELDDERGRGEGLGAAEIAHPDEPRSARPSTPVAAGSSAPARPSSVSRPAPIDMVRAAPRPESQAGARPVTTPPSPERSAPVPVRPGRRITGIVDVAGRSQVTELMRELSGRLYVALELASRPPELPLEEELWVRAETSCGELIEQMTRDGQLGPDVETEALLRDVVSETLGLGPLDELLRDEGAREIAVSRYDRIFVDRGGQLELAPRWFSSPEAVGLAIERLLSKVGQRQQLEAARQSGALMEARVEHGLLLTAALPPLGAHGPWLTLRRPSREIFELADLVAGSVLAQSMADLLQVALKARRNLLISGPPSSGRSTLLGALARAVGQGERLVSVEQLAELDLGEGPWISLLGRGDGARHSVAEALRLKPDRLVVDDVRGPEALEIVSALAGGMDGVMLVVRAGSPREALARLESLARMAPGAPPVEAVREELKRGLHLVVQLTRVADGQLRLAEISEVAGTAESLSVRPIFSSGSDGSSAPTGHVPEWAEGISLSRS